MTKEPQLLALLLPERIYRQFPATDEGIEECAEFVGEHECKLFRLDHYLDKHGDNAVRSTPLGRVNAEG